MKNMQTLLLKIDDKYLQSVINLLKPYPETECQYRIIDNNFDIDFDFVEDKAAYKSALNELKNGEAIDFDTYLLSRGIV